MSNCQPLGSRQDERANYIVYFLDGAGKIRGAEWIAAWGDVDALTRVQSMGRECACELWQLDRRVARIPAPGACC